MNKTLIKSIFLEFVWISLTFLISLTLGSILYTFKLKLYPELINNPEEIYLSCLLWGSIIGYSIKLIKSNYFEK